MVDPRRPRATLDPNRLMQKVEDGQERLRQSMEDGQSAMTDRLDAAFARIDERFNGLERDVRLGHMERGELATEIQDIRRQILDTRDTLQRDVGKQTEAAAKGAAEGVAVANIRAGATPPDLKDVVRLAMKTKFGILLTICAALATLGSGIENVPKIVKWTGGAAVGVWSYLSQEHK